MDIVGTKKNNNKAKMNLNYKKEIKRIDFLDGFRGIAILMVILFHTYARWSEIVPYGNRFSDFSLFKYGFLGVQLFFLISGFVILLSLENSSSFSSFIYKRWLRLFPAMFIATVILYFSAPFLYERPAGIPNFYSILPGIFFLEPNWVRFLTNHEVILLESAFWSIYVEVKFYVIFGLLYFVFGKMKAIKGLIFLYFLSIIILKFPTNFLYGILQELSLINFGWFAMGCLAFLFYESKNIKYILFSILIILLEILLRRKDINEVLFIFMIIVLFHAPILSEKFRIISNNKIFIFLGFISYPLYLIHENALISLIVKLNSNATFIPDFLLPVIPIICLVFIAYIIAEILEPLFRNSLIKGLTTNKRILENK